MTPESRIRWRLDTVSNRRLSLFVASVGFLLVLPSLANGLQILDDVPQRDFILAKLHGDAWAQNRPWYDVFNLVGGDEKLTSLARYFWVNPWWTWPGVTIRFFRPVAAATLYFDYALFGDHYWVAHLHSALWYFVACGLVSWLALQISHSRAAATLGALLFAVDDAHSAAVSWLAGRNAVVGLAWFAASLSFYVMASRRSQRRWALAAAICLLIALLSAENVASTIPFFFAYTLLLDERPFKNRWFAPLTIFLVIVVWFVGHKTLGFGSVGSGAYLDPLHDGVAFWRAIPARLLALVELELGPPWALFSFMRPSWFVALGLFGWWIALPALALFVALRMNRELAFWALSATIGLIPLVAGAPHDRLLTHVGIAWSILIAHEIVALFNLSRECLPAFRLVAKLFALELLCVHLVLAPWALAIGVNAQALPEIDAHALEQQPDWWKREVIAVNVPSMFTLLHLNWQRSSRGLPKLSRFTALGATDQQVEVTRTDENTLELYTRNGYLRDVFANFWRGPSVPLREGETTTVYDFAATVLSLTPDRRPQRVSIRFARSLDDPELYFVQWVDQQYKPFRFGQIGARWIIPAALDGASSHAASLVP